MIKKLLPVLMALAIVSLALPSAIAAPQGTGKIEGIAKDANQKPLAGVIVQCRNTATGQIVGTQQTSSTGAFSFTGLLPGTYVVEIVDRDGKIIGVSASLQLTATAMTLTRRGHRRHGVGDRRRRVPDQHDRPAHPRRHRCGSRCRGDHRHPRRRQRLEVVAVNRRRLKGAVRGRLQAGPATSPARSLCTRKSQDPDDTVGPILARYSQGMAIPSVLHETAS